MNKKYGSVYEARLAVDKYAKDIEHFKNEVSWLEKQLESKEEMLYFSEYMLGMAESAVLDFELDEYIDSLEDKEDDEDDEDEGDEDPYAEHNLDYLRSRI